MSNRIFQLLRGKSASKENEGYACRFSVSTEDGTDCTAEVAGDEGVLATIIGALASKEERVREILYKATGIVLTNSSENFDDFMYMLKEVARLRGVIDNDD